jgi:hypothetical protein
LCCCAENATLKRKLLVANDTTKALSTKLATAHRGLRREEGRKDQVAGLKKELTQALKSPGALVGAKSAEKTTKLEEKDNEIAALKLDLTAQGRGSMQGAAAGASAQASRVPAMPQSAPSGFVPATGYMPGPPGYVPPGFVPAPGYVPQGYVQTQGYVPAQGYAPSQGYGSAQTGYVPAQTPGFMQAPPPGGFVHAPVGYPQVPAGYGQASAGYFQSPHFRP